MFSILPKTNFIFSVTFILPSANAFNFNKSKIMLFGKELNHTFEGSVFLLMRAPSPIVASPPEKPLNQDYIMNICLSK